MKMILFKKCRKCGTEAHMEGELSLFIKSKNSRWGRDNICKKCNNIYHLQYYHKNPEYQKEIMKKTIHFKKKTIYLPDNPRIGKCSLCGRIKNNEEEQFHIHHIKYNQKNVLESTIELCQSCHTKIHWKEHHEALSYLRKCKDCGLEAKTENDLELFVKSKTGFYGRSNLCNKCNNIRIKKWLLDHPYPKKFRKWKRYGYGSYKEYREAWEVIHRDEICAKRREQYYKNIEKSRENNRKRAARRRLKIKMGNSQVI